MLLDDPCAEELIDDGRDRLPRESGVPRELSPAGRRMAVDRLDQAQPVELANAEGAGAGGHVIPLRRSYRPRFSQRFAAIGRFRIRWARNLRLN